MYLAGTTEKVAARHYDADRREPEAATSIPGTQHLWQLLDALEADEEELLDLLESIDRNLECEQDSLRRVFQQKRDPILAGIEWQQQAPLTSEHRIK
eukprot:jgi/Hompol1/6177/HPOL_002185-RA